MVPATNLSLAAVDKPRDLKTWIRNTQRVRKSKGTPSNAATNPPTCDPDALRRSPRDSPRGHRACRGPLVDAVDKICRTSRASHETTRLSASAAVQCLRQSPAVRARRLSPDTFQQHIHSTQPRMDREQVHQNTCQRLRRPTPIGLRTERDHLYTNRTPGIGTLLIGATKYCRYTDSLAHCRPPNH